MAKNFEIADEFIAEQNQKAKPPVAEDYEYLARQLRRRNVEIEDLTAKQCETAIETDPPSRGRGQESVNRCSEAVVLERHVERTVHE